MQYKLEQFIENREFPAIFIIQKAEETQILRHWHKEIEITYVASSSTHFCFIDASLLMDRALFSCIQFGYDIQSVLFFSKDKQALRHSTT